MASGESIYNEGDYRDALRKKLGEIQQNHPGFTLKRLASKIPIQYTYLSKAMNHPKVHLGEDHLFTMCDLLQFLPEERDFLLLKRAHATASNPDRKKYLRQVIDSALKKRQLNAEVQGYSSKTQAQEIQYLFDPMCMVVQMALDIEPIRKNPAILCEKLGLGVGELKEILKKLARNEFLELEEGAPLKVKRLLRNSLHYGTDHPFMRVHQSLMKIAMSSQLLRVPEENKQSFVVTFTMDEQSFQKVKDRFQAFLKDVELIATKAKSHHVYQMNFDLFRWF